MFYLIGEFVSFRLCGPAALLDGNFYEREIDASKQGTSDRVVDPGRIEFKA